MRAKAKTSYRGVPFSVALQALNVSKEVGESLLNEGHLVVSHSTKKLLYVTMESLYLTEIHLSEKYKSPTVGYRVPNSIA